MNTIDDQETPGDFPPDGWDQFNHRVLCEFIKTQHQQQGAYAVFDWDNTCVFLDVEEACLAYQLAHVDFEASASQLEHALRQRVPLQPMIYQGRKLTIDDFVGDILDSYAQIDRHRPQEKSPHYWNFVSKFRLLYDLLDSTFGAPVSFPWLTQRFVGMRPPQVQELARQAVRWQLQSPIETQQWQSSSEIPGRCGVVQVPWHNGLRLLPQMQSLQRALTAYGIDVWICTASYEEVIAGVACSSEFGYQVPRQRVLGMRLSTDEGGCITDQALADYPLTFAAGKTEAIERFIRPHYGHGPNLVAGDSAGDLNMLRDFPDTKLRLLIDMQHPADSPIGELASLALREYGQDTPSILLQGRDNRTGCFCPSQRSRPPKF